MLAMKSILFLCTLAIIFTSCSDVSVETDDNFELVKLPDGSEIYLNRHSSVTYDESFNPRKIELNGEAFFMVSPGESPFVVSTPSGEIKVLGTDFNVKSTVEELEVEVEEGFVELKTELSKENIKRGGRAVYSESKNAVEQGKAEFKHKVWTNELKAEFKKLGKDVGREGKKAGKEFQKVGKDIKDEFK